MAKKKNSKKPAKKVVKKPVKKAVKKTTKKKAVKKAAPKKVSKDKPATVANVAAIKGVVTATITAIFTETDPGLSELKARHNGITQELDQSGTIICENVSQGDIIGIKGKSLGSSDISIDVSASPQQKKFGPGKINFNFSIL